MQRKHTPSDVIKRAEQLFEQGLPNRLVCQRLPIGDSACKRARRKWNEAKKSVKKDSK